MPIDKNRIRTNVMVGMPMTPAHIIDKTIDETVAEVVRVLKDNEKLNDKRQCLAALGYTEIHDAEYDS